MRCKPMLNLLLVFVVIGALWLVRGRRSGITRDGHRLPKPPNTLPVLGNGLLFLQARHKLFQWFTECERRFGLETFEISVPTLPPGVVIYDPKNLEFVLRRDDLFTKGDFFRRRSWDLFGYGIINADGDLWKVQRKAGQRFFSPANLKSLVDLVLPLHLADTRSYLLQQARERRLVDLQHVFLDFTTRLMGKLAYDMDMQASSTFSEAFDFASGAIGERFQNPFWRLTDILFGSRFRSAVAEVKRFGRSIVAVAIQKRSEKLSGGDKNNGTYSNSISGSLINFLIDGIGDHKIVADAALNYLSAGRDTTAQSLTWTFYLLMRHPDVAQNIRTELRTLFPEHKTLNLSSTTLPQPSSLPYTMAVFYESLRLYPPVPFEIKQCEAAATLPDGTFLPQGSVVVSCIWAMNRSETSWGPDADRFRPERWFEEDTATPLENTRVGGKSENKKWKVISKTASEFPVFHGGPRSCLGRKMAELLGVYVIASLIWEFEFYEENDNGRRMERVSRNSLTLPMEGGLPCYVAVREQAFELAEWDGLFD